MHMRVDDTRKRMETRSIDHAIRFLVDPRIDTSELAIGDADVEHLDIGVIRPYNGYVLDHKIEHGLSFCWQICVCECVLKYPILRRPALRGTRGPTQTEVRCPPDNPMRHVLRCQRQHPRMRTFRR